MSKHKQTGIKGEQIAVNFLLNTGYTILHTNWRHGHKEIDIIAKKDNTLAIIEVKTRSNFDFGFPEEAVNLKKQTFLREAGQAYVDDNPGYEEVRFDIISILLTKGEVKEILHLEAAF
jgi:putative endonuclease